MSFGPGGRSVHQEGPGDLPAEHPEPLRRPSGSLEAEVLALQRAGRGFAYTPVDDASLAAGQMNRALDGGADHDAVLTRFVSGLSGRDARLLRHLLDAGEDGG